MRAFPWAALALAGLASAGPKRDVIFLAVPNDDPDRGVYRACEDVLSDRAVVQNASVQWRDLHESAPLPSGDLEHAPPAWWPAGMRKDWDDGIAACKTRAKPPYGPGNDEARVCGGKLAEALWQRWLEKSAPTLYVQVLLEPLSPNDPSDDRQRLHVRAYEPGTPTERTADRQELLSDEAREVASVLALRVATGGGMQAARPILRTLPVPLRASEPPLPDVAPVGVPRRCLAPLAESLAIEPADARLSRILVRLWGASAAASPQKGPPLKCELDAQTREEELVRRKVMLGSATLSCGKVRLVSKLHDDNEELLLQAMSADLVKKLVDAHCMGQLSAPR